MLKLVVVLMTQFLIPSIAIVQPVRRVKIFYSKMIYWSSYVNYKTFQAQVTEV